MWVLPPLEVRGADCRHANAASMEHLSLCCRALASCPPVLYWTGQRSCCSCCARHQSLTFPPPADVSPAAASLICHPPADISPPAAAVQAEEAALKKAKEALAKGKKK